MRYDTDITILYTNREFIHRCKHGILQYTVFHLLTTFIAFVCGQLGVYEEGKLSPKNVSKELQKQ